MNPSTQPPPDLSVHARKRRKNYAVLALVLGWCVLIFLVSMAKLAHSQDATPAVPLPYMTQRTNHQQQMDANTDDLKTGRAAHQSVIDQSHAEIEDNNAAHQQTMVGAKQNWIDAENAGADQRAADKAEDDSLRAAHQQSLDPNPKQWWGEYPPPVPPQE